MELRKEESQKLKEQLLIKPCFPVTTNTVLAAQRPSQGLTKFLFILE